MKGHHRRNSSVAPPLPSRRKSVQRKLLERQKAFSSTRLIDTNTSSLPTKIYSPEPSPASSTHLPLPPPSISSVPPAPSVPTRHDSPADFFIVVGLENGRRVQERQQQEQQRVRATTSQGSSNAGFHFDTTSVDLLLPEQRELTPEILDQYPRVDYTNAVVDPMIPAFCMPLGVTTLPVHTNLPLPVTHQFTLTTGDGSKVYGVSLRFYEAIAVGSLHLPNPSLPRMLSDEIYYEMFLQWLSVPVPNGDKNRGSSTSSAFTDKETARHSVTLWKLLEKYEYEIEEQSSVMESTTRTREFAAMISNSTTIDCLKWLINTELCKELMHMLETDNNKESSSNLQREHCVETKTTMLQTIKMASDTNKNSTTNDVSAIDMRMVHDVRDALESQMLPAYAAYLDNIVKSIRLVPKCLVLTGRYPFFRVYESVLHSIHTLLCSTASSSTNTNNITLSVPIERAIVHFLDEIPLPPSGKERFEFNMTPNPSSSSIVLPTIRMERPPLNRLPLINFSYKTLVSSLSVAQIITVVTALILDQKVIVLSEDISKISLVCECLCSLLFPLRWQNPYIPLLPRSMQDMVYAPMGYLMGMPMALYPGDDDPMLMGEVVVVDLDESCIVHADNGVNLNVPKKIRVQLTKDVQSAVKEVDDATMGTYLREAFVMFFARLLRGYKSYLSSSESFEELFDKKSFMKYYQKREKIRGDELKEAMEFLDSFLDTQMFQMFIEDRVWPSERNFEVLLFDAYIEKLEHSRSMSSFLDDTSQEVTLTTTIGMECESVRTWLKERRRLAEEEKHQTIDSSESSEKYPVENHMVNHGYQYNSTFPLEMDHEFMSHLSQCALQKTALMHGEEHYNHTSLMSRHRRTSASAVVMESVYLQFYTKRKMFSTRHRFSIKAARDALDQTEIVRSALEAIQRIDANFVSGLRSCRRMHEHTFRWATMDPSPLMRGNYWIAADRILATTWEELVEKHRRCVETEVCEPIREACRSLRNTIKLLETEEEEILDEMDRHKSEVEKAKVKRDAAEQSYQKLMMKVNVGSMIVSTKEGGTSRGSMASTSSIENDDEDVANNHGNSNVNVKGKGNGNGRPSSSSRSSSFSLSPSRRPMISTIAESLKQRKTDTPMTHAQNERLLRVKRKREETRLTYSEKITKLTHVLNKYNDVMGDVMATWEAVLRRHHATLQTAFESLCRLHAATYSDEMAVVLKELKYRVEPPSGSGGNSGSSGSIGLSSGKSSRESSLRVITTSSSATLGSSSHITEDKTTKKTQRRPRRETATAMGAVLREIGKGLGDNKVEEEEEDDEERKKRQEEEYRMNRKRSHMSKASQSISAGALLRFASDLLSPTSEAAAVARTRGKSVLQKFLPTLTSAQSRSPITSSTMLSTMPMSFRKFRDSMVDEFGSNVYDLHKQRLRDAYSQASTFEANEVIERVDGFDVWHDNTRSAKNVAREGASYLESLMAVYTTWTTELTTLYGREEFIPLVGRTPKELLYQNSRLGGGSGKKKNSIIEHGAKSKKNKKKNKKKKDNSGRFWQNSTLQRGAQAIFHMLSKGRADSIDLVRDAIREHLHAHLVRSRTHLKATFHRLENESRESTRTLREAHQRWQRAVHQLQEAEESSAYIVEQLTEYQMTTRESGTEKIVTLTIHDLSMFTVQWKERKGEGGSTFCVVKSFDTTTKSLDDTTHVAVGMVVTHVNNLPVGRTYESAVEAISAMKDNTETVVLASSNHVKNINTMERLASKLSQAARHVKACVLTERAARKEHRVTEADHEAKIESIYREFRHCETDRVRGVRSAVWHVMSNGAQKCVDRQTLAATECARIVLSIDSLIDFKVYEDFNARIRTYHAKDDRQQSVVSPSSTATSMVAGGAHKKSFASSSLSTVVEQEGSACQAQQPQHHRIQSRSLPNMQHASGESLSPLRHLVPIVHRRLSIGAPPVPPRPTSGSIERHRSKMSLLLLSQRANEKYYSNPMDSLMRMSSQASSLRGSVGIGGVVLSGTRSRLHSSVSQHSSALETRHSQLFASKSGRSGSRHLTLCEHLETEKFPLIVQHLESGRSWYRALQHHLETRSSIEVRLSTAIEESLEKMYLSNMPSHRTREAAHHRDQRNNESKVPAPSSSAAAATATSASVSSTRRERGTSLHVVTGAATINTHMQLYHSLHMAYKGWSRSLSESSEHLSTLAVRVRHLKRELKGTVGMLQKRSDELDKQLRQALYAPRKAEQKCRDFEEKLKLLETRYETAKKRARQKGGGNTTSRSGGTSSTITRLENSVLGLRDKTEAAKAKVVHALTEARVMRAKHTRCVQQMMTLTETKLLQLYREMRAVSETFLRHHMTYIHKLERHNEILSSFMMEFDHVGRTETFVRSLHLDEYFEVADGFENETVLASPTSSRSGTGITSNWKDTRLSNISSNSNVSNNVPQQQQRNSPEQEAEVRLFLHRTLDVALDDAREASFICNQLSILFHSIHHATENACEEMETNDALRSAISFSSDAATNDVSNNRQHLTSATSSSTTTSTATAGSRLSPTRHHRPFSMERSGALSDLKRSGGAMMERSLLALSVHEETLNAALRRCTLHIQEGAHRSFERIAVETTSKVSELEQRQSMVVEEHDRLSSLCMKASAVRTKANAHWWKTMGRDRRGVRLRQASEDNWVDPQQKVTLFGSQTKEDKDDSRKICVVQCVKRSVHSSSLSRRLGSGLADWVRRDICVDDRYVGWYQPAPSLNPTGGLQLRHIEDVSLFDTNDTLVGAPVPFENGPCRWIVEIRRRSVESVGRFRFKALKTGGISSKTWSFGFDSDRDARTLSDTLNQLLQTLQQEDMQLQQQQDMKPLSTREEATVEKRQSTASHHIYVRHVLNMYKWNDYLEESRFAAKSLVELQSQRQLFLYSILRSLMETKSDLIQKFCDGCDIASIFVVGMNSLDMLQEFIVTTLEEESTASTNGSSTSSRSNFGSMMS